jgi:hypothetical protein
MLEKMSKKVEGGSALRRVSHLLTLIFKMFGYSYFFYLLQFGDIRRKEESKLEIRNIKSESSVASALV